MTVKITEENVTKWIVQDTEGKILGVFESQEEASKFAVLVEEGKCKHLDVNCILFYMLPKKTLLLYYVSMLSLISVGIFYLFYTLNK